MQVLTYVLSIEIAFTVTVLCREASRERGGEQRKPGEREEDTIELGCTTIVRQAGSESQQAGGQQVLEWPWPWPTEEVCYFPEERL